MAIVPELSCHQVVEPAFTALSAGPPHRGHHIAGMALTKYDRFWAVYAAGVLVCICVYKRGAAEVIRRLTQVAHGRAAQ